MHTLQRLVCRYPFSSRLHEACGGSKRTGIAKRLAAHLGIRTMYISHWRFGRELPSDATALKIAKFMKWREEETLVNLYDELWQRAMDRRSRYFQRKLEKKG
jgi:hypothetical protein